MACASGTNEDGSEYDHRMVSKMEVMTRIILNILVPTRIRKQSSSLIKTLMA